MTGNMQLDAVPYSVRLSSSLCASQCCILICLAWLYAHLLLSTLYLYFCIGVWIFTCIRSMCVCVCAHRRGGETKDEMTVWTADATHSKYTHFLISHVELPAAPQESNNDLVITPRQLTKELLTRKSSDFTSEKRRPTSLYNSCQIVQ